MRWGKCDFKELEELQKRLLRLREQERRELCEALAKELAARLLARVIKRTPEGTYPAKSGVKGGTLRRGWTAGKENVSKKGNVVGVTGKNGFASNLTVTQKGSRYEIIVSNDTSYASYVEYGHRTANHKGWVPGHFMLTISEKEVQELAPRLIEKRLAQKLEECFHGK